MYNFRKRFILLSVIPFFLGSCTKFVKVANPATQLIRSTVFSDDASATSAIIGVYSSMMANPGMASINTGLYAGLSADEFTSYSNDPGLGQFYSNALLPSNADLTAYWGNAYQYIYGANAVLEGLNNNALISNSLKQQLSGEARFIRAFCYFYLTNLFGDVPLILSTNYAQNAVASRTPRNLVYNQIITDLMKAQDELGDQYVQADNNPTNERVRPNRWTATAMLARIYLFKGDWADANSSSTTLINQTSKYNLVFNLDSVFLANSPEAIFQLMPVNNGINATWEGFSYILNGAPSGSVGVSLNNAFVTAFETGDLRKMHWVDSIQVSGYTYYFPYKYKIASDLALTEYYMVLRLSEQFLIRAEARAMTGDLNGAASDLNIIRNRAGLVNTSASDKSSILQAILTERRFELFSEWGHRWLDLKRTGTAGAVLSNVKSPGWQESDTLYPIPQTEIQTDPNLTQNPNY